ncbi:leucine-rich repeat domain-containing protein [Prevotella sp.]|uniref:leucine-rich repeat domain-containing protein n=1 Tax=Prevotella sp. TaxID=59823 RepID=UPI0026002C3A|nr:leucine-rich repeat domain-containing protein [Prevotella sp.]
MKSLITKRQLLFVILVLLCGINPIYADTSKKLYVNCGNLSDLLPERERFKITDLTLSGQLDIRDLEVIRQMGGCRESYESRYNGHLRYLDLSNAEFVSGGTFGTYADDYFRTSDLNDGSGDYLFSDMKSLHTIKLPNSMEIMGQYLFVGCESLTSVTLPKSLKTLPDRTFSSCFNQNDNLTSILIDDSNPYYSSDGSALFDKYKTKMFFAVKSLREYAIPSSVSEIIQEAFYNCRHLKTLVLPLRLKSVNGHHFSNCDSLYSISVDEKNPYLCSDGSALYNKDKSELVFVYHTVRKMSIPSSVTKIGDYAFYNCTNLTSIELPSGVTEIGDYAFYNCTNLSSLTLPSGVKEIGFSAFQGCKSLTSVTIPSGVKYISSFTFRDCESLRFINLPSDLKYIGEEAFEGCTGLTSIYAFMEKPCEIDETTFENETIINATLYVPKGSLLDYWDDNQWKKFMNIEEFDVTSIGSLNTNVNDVQEVSRYSDNGQRLNTPAKGLNIVKYKVV